MTTTFDRLCAILARDYPLQPAQLTPDAPLESLGIDSLGVAELLFNVEDAFGIALPAQPVALQTVGDVARFIDSLIAARAGAAAGQAQGQTGGQEETPDAPAQPLAALAPVPAGAAALP